ncbi:unnamed protein product, partial [Didymodactylos carnosus]
MLMSSTIPVKGDYRVDKLTHRRSIYDGMKWCRLCVKENCPKKYSIDGFCGAHFREEEERRNMNSILPTTRRSQRLFEEKQIEHYEKDNKKMTTSSNKRKIEDDDSATIPMESETSLSATSFKAGNIRFNYEDQNIKYHGKQWLVSCIKDNCKKKQHKYGLCFVHFKAKQQIEDKKNVAKRVRQQRVQKKKYKYSRQKVDNAETTFGTTATLLN